MNPALSNHLIGRFFPDERDALVGVMRHQDNARFSPTVLATVLQQKSRQLLEQRGKNCRYRAFRRVFQDHDACEHKINEELTRWLCVAAAHTARDHPAAALLLRDATADPVDLVDELFY
jgi:hypothetical protein